MVWVEVGGGGGGQHYSSGAFEPAAIEITVLILHTSLQH